MSQTRYDDLGARLVEAAKLAVELHLQLAAETEALRSPRRPSLLRRIIRRPRSRQILRQEAA